MSFISQHTAAEIERAISSVIADTGGTNAATGQTSLTNTWTIPLWTGNAGFVTVANLTSHVASGVTASDVGLGNVENIALSTWSGSANVTTLGTITSGTWNGAAISSAYIGSHTHAASDVVSGTFADARIAQSNVTQHQAALSITESQISDFGAYATAAALTTHTGDTANPHSVTATQIGLGNVENTALSTWAGSTNLTTLGTITIGTWNGGTIASAYIGSHTHAASDVTSGTFADARIAQTNVTQHQAALSITESQISDLGSYATTTALSSHTGNTSNPHSVTAAQLSDFAEAVDDRVAAFVQDGTGITWTYVDASNTLTGNVSLASFTTSDLSEGTNLYYTDARARAAISVSGDLSYNSGTGVISFSETYGTASELLTALLTVDGASSSLDADLLDGQEGTYYLAWANLTGVPSTFSPSAHTHASSEITDFQEAVEDVTGNLITAGTNINVSYNDVSGVLTISSTASTDYLNDIGDVTITSAATGDLVRWNGTAWVNYADSNYAASSHTHAASDVTSGTLADARIAESNVTQHESALSIASSQISDKASANGVASLDSTGKIPSSQLPAIALSEVFVVSSESAQLALTAQEGDTVVRTDQSKTYIHNGGTAGTMADYTELQVPSTAPVTSVNGYTGTVSLTTSDISEGTNLYYTSARFDSAFTAKDTDDLSEGATNQYFTNARSRSAISLTTTNSSELSYDSGTGVFSYVSPTTVADANSVTLEVRNTTGSTIAKGAAVYISGHSGSKILIDLADSDASGKYPAIGLASGAIANNSDGEVTVYGTLAGVDTSSYSVGDVLYLSSTAGALTNTRPTSNADAVQNIGRVARSDSNGIIIVSGSGRANDIPNLTNTHVFIGGASGNEQRALATGDILSGTFADARISQSSVTQHQAALSITESQISDLGTYQTQDAGLTSIAGLTTAADKMLYTTASDTYAVADLTSFARSILDDADAASVRTTIGVDAAGTDNSTDVTLATVSGNYLTITGQEITAGTVPVSLGGTGATTAAGARTALGVDAAGTDNSTDVTLAAVTGNYLSITGQEITAGTVPISLGGTGATTASAARTALDVDQAGTDNSTDVTLAGTYDYLTLSGQQITLGQIDLTTDVTGALPVANGGTGATTAAGARTALGVDAAGTDNSTDVTLAGSYDYLTLSGQQITLAQIDLATDVTGVLPSANIGSHTHTASNISDFSEAVDDRVAAMLVAGTNITLTYDDGANTLTVDASGGGGGFNPVANAIFAGF